MIDLVGQRLALILHNVGRGPAVARECEAPRPRKGRREWQSYIGRHAFTKGGGFAFDSGPFCASKRLTHREMTMYPPKRFRNAVEIYVFAVDLCALTIGQLSHAAPNRVLQNKTRFHEGFAYLGFTGMPPPPAPTRPAPFTSTMGMCPPALDQRRAAAPGPALWSCQQPERTPRRLLPTSLAEKR